jgi:hypothetical protein
MSVPLQRLSASQAYRQSIETPAFEAEHDWPLDSTQWGSITVGGGNVSHSAPLSAHVLAVTTASGDRVVLRSHARPRASANRSRSLTLTLHHAGTGNAQQTKRWGLFDDNNGLFFELDGEQLKVVRRSNITGSVVDTEVLRAQWTAAGKSTGATPRDVSKTHVYEIREVWPNGDAIFLMDGEPVHQIDTDGSVVGPAYRTARLPVSIEIVNDGASAADSVYVHAASVSVDGVPTGKAFSAQMVDASVTTEQPLVCIRPAATFGGQANLGEVIADALQVICSDDALIRVTVGGTITGGTWSAHPNAASFAEVNDDATSISGGRSVEYLTDGGLSVSDLASLFQALRIQADGTTLDTLAITAEAITGSISARAALSWKEIR